jgi:putative SOS response-associated peptidase YedK
VYDRMPVILKPDDYARWLDPGEHRAGALMPLLAPLPDDRLSAPPARKLVNNPSHEDPRGIERLT